MYFKQESEGRYSVQWFGAKDLPAIARMVKVLEEGKKQAAIEGIEIARQEQEKTDV